MRFDPLWRQASPTVGPLIDVLRPWIQAASQPFADWYFGDPDVTPEILTEWMARPTSEVYLGRSLLLHEGDRPAGCLLSMGGADLARCRAADFAAFCQDIGSGPEAEAIIEQVLVTSRTLFAPVPDDELYISRVAIDPERRGQGLGKALVQQAIALRSAEGFRKFRLDVSADNTAAIRAYEAVGLRIAGRVSDPGSGLEYCSMTLAA